MCVTINVKGISQVASFLPQSGHSGHGRNSCSLDPVAVDPQPTIHGIAVATAATTVSAVAK
jgi:hypothetical protein